MTGADMDDAVWECVRARMPRCEHCGVRTLPGYGPAGFLAVCPTCSTVWGISTDDAARIIAAARQQAQQDQQPSQEDDQ